MSIPASDSSALKRCLVVAVAIAGLVSPVPAVAQHVAARSPTRHLEIEEGDQATDQTSLTEKKPKTARGFFERFVAGSAENAGDPSGIKIALIATTYAAGLAAFTGAGYFFVQQRDQGERARDFAADKPSDFCYPVTAPDCETYRQLVRVQNAEGLMALGLGAGAVLFVLSGVLLAEYWPNEPPTPSLELRASASPDSASLHLQLSF